MDVTTRTARLLLLFHGILCTLACTAVLLPAPGNAAGRLTAATLNIWHDQKDWRARMEIFEDSLRALHPDVVFLQEVIQKTRTADQAPVPNQAEALAESLGYAAVFVSVDPPGAPKRYGNAILTRHPIVARHEIKLEPLDDYRVAAHVRIDVEGRTVDAYVTHLHHTDEGAAIRSRQVQDLLAFIDSTNAGGAVLLGGDLNAAPSAPELQPIHRRYSDSYGRIHAGLEDSTTTTLNPAMGHPHRRIDYIFSTPDYLKPVASEIFLDSQGPGGMWATDHFCVWSRFEWVPRQR